MPRLSQGETAESVKKVVELMRASTIARLARLEECLAGNLEWGSHFSSFEQFAAWHAPELGIYRMTSKTLRLHVNTCHFGGQKRLLELLGTTSKFKKGAPPENPFRKGIENRAGALMEMTDRYLDLLERLKRLATTSGNATEELSHHLRLHGNSQPHLRKVK